jgi:TonB family protein
MSFPNRPFPVPGRLKPSQAGPSVNSAQTEASERRPEFSESNAEVVLSSLRAAIAARASAPAAILKAIAEAAQALTSADGAALALRRDGVVVCCARSGEAAPDVGTRLSSDSGISSECLRMGEALRCDDAYTDHRVDPMVCRVLGLRAIAIAPVREEGHVIGILEAFSTRPYAFNDRHMGFLTQLAELTEMAQAQEKPKERLPRFPVQIMEEPEAPPPAPAFSETWAPSESATVADRLLEKLHLVKRRRRVAGVALATLVLISLIAWWSLHEPERHTVQSPPVTYAEVVPTERAAETPPASEVISVQLPPAEPTTEKSESRTENRHTHHGRTQKREVEVPDVVTRVENSPLPVIRVPVPSIKRTQPHPATAASGTISEPQIILVPSDNTTLGSLLGASPRTPKLPPPISSGATPAILQHKVAPVYPRNAAAAGLSGTVVLQITVGETGKVRGLKVMEGNPMLARAAMDAVRQWRYRPSTLNGKPAEAQTQVTVNFQLP